MLEVIYHLGCFTAHEFDRILIAEPVGAFDRVVKMVVPVVLVHVAQRCANAALGRHRVGAGRKNLAEHCHIQASARELQRGPHAGAASAHNDDIKFSSGYGVSHEFLKTVRLGGAAELVFLYKRHRTWIDQPAQPTSQTSESTCKDSRSASGLT